MSLSSRHGLSSQSNDLREEKLDPRIQLELERLNKASDDINRLELQLDEARANFRQALTDFTCQLDAQAKRLGACIDRARPYYAARVLAKEAQLDTQNVAVRYERACSQLAAAKEMVYLAEQGFFRRKGEAFDPAWQEMLNHATIKVNDAEKERFESEVEHKRTAQVFNEAEQSVKRLQKDLKRSIAKSRPYFEMKSRIHHQMEDQKKQVSELEDGVQLAKKRYAEALTNLEAISDDIHRRRRETTFRKEMGVRGAGVGAETPSPPPAAESSGSTSPCSPTALRSAEEEGHVTAPVNDSAAATAGGIHGNHDAKSRAPHTVNNISKKHPGSQVSSQGREGRVHSAGEELPPVEGAGRAIRTLPARPSSLDSQSEEKAAARFANQTSLDAIHVTSGLQARREIAMDASRKPPRHPLSSQSRSPPPEGASGSATGVVFRIPSPGGVMQRQTTMPELLRSQQREDKQAFKRPRPATTPTAAVPTVRLTATTPGEESEEGELANSQPTNAEVMASLQRAKGLSTGSLPGLGGRPFLRPNRRSQDDILDGESDTETCSLASASMLDDEQIEGLMLEATDYSRFLDDRHADDRRARAQWKRRSLPATLAYLEEFVVPTPGGVPEAPRRDAAEPEAEVTSSPEKPSPTESDDVFAAVDDVSRHPTAESPSPHGSRPEVILVTYHMSRDKSRGLPLS